MLRSLVVAATVAALGLGLMVTDASARGPGGFRGGFRGGPSFRAGPSFARGPAFRAGPAFARGPALRFAGPRRFVGARRFGFVGLPLAGYPYYYGYDSCVTRVATPFGWRWINTCDDYYPY